MTDSDQEQNANASVSPALDLSQYAAALPDSGKNVSMSKSSDEERKANAEEARALTRDNYKKNSYQEDIETRKWKRRIGISAAIIAIIEPFGIFFAAYQILFGCFRYHFTDSLLKIAVVSATVLNFVVIYGIIIRSTLVSVQQSADDSNFPIRAILEAFQRKFGGE